MKLFKLFVVLGLILFGSGCGLKEQGPQDAGYTRSGQQSGQQSEGHRHGPPPAAYAACKGLAAGAAASFTNQQGETINGVCQADHNGTLVVRREHPQN